MCKEYDGYEKTVKEIENGTLYLNGNRINLEEFLNGNIKKIDTIKKTEVEDFFDITKWDNE